MTETVAFLNSFREKSRIYNKGRTVALDSQAE